MSKVPSLSYAEIITAFKRDGWLFVRQKGSHIRLEKILDNETLKITVPGNRSGGYPNVTSYKIRRFRH
jgi:predicted RNA binding protein YcfA (HicA-like mRNA interferase family)